MLRRFLAPLALCIAVVNLSVQAETTPPKPVSSSDAPKQLQTRQDELAQIYKGITRDLRTLMYRLEKSNRIEDQNKAKLIKKAIETADAEGIDNKFTSLARTLSGKGGTIDLGSFTEAERQNKELVEALKLILNILETDDGTNAIKEEQRRLEAMLKELKGIIRAEKIERVNNLSDKGNVEKRADDQNKLAKKTDDLAKLLDPKGSQGDPKKGDPKNGDPKGGDPKKGDPKGGDPKGGDPKKGDPKGGDPKGGDPKKGDPKGGDPKGGDPKKGDPKGGDPKGGDPKGGDPKGGDPKGGDPKDGPPPPAGPKAPGADNVKKAVQDQKEAAKKIEEKKKDDSITKQSDAIKELETAQAALEKRLKQLREEELERLLANLEARCQKMLDMQIAVYENTKAINGTVEGLKKEGKEPTNTERQRSQTQSDKEAEIVVEGNKTVEILKSEGTAVAFPQVFEEMIKDMERVKERLYKTDVGKDTQFVETQIIDTLKEMIEALKKAQQDLKKDPPPPGPPGQSPPSDQQKLLDEIAELKMIRNLQVRVNERTVRWNGEAKVKGEEQNDEPQIRKELKDLSERQTRIEDMARDISTGKNK